MRILIGALLGILLLLTPQVNAFNLEYTSSDELEVKVIERLLMDITHKQVVKVFVFGYNTLNIRRYTRHISIVNDCREAEVVIMGIDNEGIINKCRGKPLIVSDRRLFDKYRDIIIGAFYWRKGRPHLLLIEDNLKDISLPSDYRPYMIRRDKDHQGTSLEVLQATR